MHWELSIQRNISWEELLKLEAKAYEAVRADKSKKILILSEPKPTYTYGRNAQTTDLLWTKERLLASGATVAPVGRGGKWTYHGPGQVLLFPILHLPSHGYHRLGIRLFMDRFRSAAQVGLARMGLSTEIGNHPFGIFVKGEKLASFGLAFQNGISTHGMAVYVTPQHDRFQAIHPCGVPDGKTTSISEHLCNTTWEDVAAHVTESVENGLISD